MDWPLIIPDARRSAWDTATAADRESATALAVSLLHSLTGRVFGLAEVTVRPCGVPAPAFSTYGGQYASGPITRPGVLLLSACGCSSFPCPCVAGSQIALPGPVHDVVAVMIDGHTLATADYKVRDRRWLCRIDGHRWPQHQRMDAADDAEGAFTVTYRRGLLPPSEGQLAAGLLACDILSGIGGGACALPANVTSVARQGVNIEIDPVAYLDAGLTGISVVDQWIRSVNPRGLRSTPRVLSPDASDQAASFT
ncbi:MAG: hypothetical protein QM658_03115 [Gordonia sp. (in: high G+C Gram-positive bacteria)]